MAKLARFLETPPEKTIAENSTRFVDNSEKVLAAIAAIPQTDLTHVINLLNTIARKDVDLSGLSHQIRNIPVTDFKPVLKAVNNIKIKDVSGEIGELQSKLVKINAKVADLHKELKNIRRKKREFRFDIEREEFSDLAHTIKATEI